jgi:hypothetical protein
MKGYKNITNLTMQVIFFSDLDFFQTNDQSVLVFYIRIRFYLFLKFCQPTSELLFSRDLYNN